MEYYFDNSCLLDQKTLAELARRTVNVWLRVACYLLAVLMLALAAAEITLSHFNFTSGLYIGLSLMILMAAYCSPIWAANRGAKRNFTLYRRAPELRTSFGEEKFHIHNMQSGAEHDLDYSMVRRVVETKNLYILLLEGRMAVLAAKDGFLTGTEEDFRKFILSKCGDKAHFRQNA